MQENTAKEQSLDELIEELAAPLQAATTLRKFCDETGEVWALETLKRLPYPEEIYFLSGRNRIFITKKLIRYLLTRGKGCN